MKLVSLPYRGTNRKKIGQIYTFEYLEKSKIIDVVVSDQSLYEIRWESNFWKCDCPGFLRHLHCWHTNPAVISIAVNGVRNTEPWTEWAEEVGILRRERRRQYAKA